MTRDEFIRISRKWARGFITGAALVLLIVCAIFLPRFWRLGEVVQPEQPMLLGVPDDFIVKRDVSYAAMPEPFRSVAPGIEQQDNTRKNVRLYEVCPPLWPGPQQTGDCVSMGIATPVYVRACITAGISGAPIPPSQVFQPHQYGIARVQIGNGRPSCRSAGAYPSDAVRGFMQFGYVYYHEAEGFGYRYSGKLADQWGCDGPPRELINIGKQRSGGDAYPIRSVSEWRDALCNGYPVTVAIPWKPGRVYRGRDGRSCMAFDGKSQGGHQICSIAYDGSSGEPYFLLFNSHGANWPSGASRADGIPPGSVWVDSRWSPWIVDNGELYAISDVPGFEAEELDLKILDDLKLSLASSTVPPAADR